MAAKKGSIRPHKWISGPDPDIHKKYFPFLQGRSQANYRKEGWTLTFEEFCELWTEEKWALRGRKSHELALTRKDNTQPWSFDNCHIVTRQQQLREANSRRREEIKE